MRLRAKLLIGLSATLLIVAVVLVALAYRLTTKSFPQTTGIIELPSIRSEVKIYRDSYGVPHIFAESDYDAYFAVGYVHAQDRLWQMELIRRAGMGRLAEVLGAEALPIDRMFRTLRLSESAQKVSALLEGVVLNSMQAYADGISRFIADHKGRYPLELDMLDIQPEPWRIEHSTLVSRLMAWELNYGRWIDLVQGYVAEKIGIERAGDLYPDWPSHSPVIIPKELHNKKVALDDFPIIAADLLYRTTFGGGGRAGGSNAWAVTGARSTSGSALLANDPHLMLNAPARWYEIHLSAPGLNVYGVSIPGVPYVVIGRNEHIAWGVTNAMLDDTDFYIEQVDSLQHPTQYRVNNQWRPMRHHVDTILVKHGDPVILTSYYTHRGPVINRMEPAKSLSTNLISMRWTGHHITNDPATFYIINRASSWEEFEEGIKHFNAPAQNYVYADVKGNIGYRTGGSAPVRAGKGPTLPYPGWTDTYDWKGFIPFSQMPHILNPSSGYVATANNKIIDDPYPFYLSTYWEPDWRITRIVELLGGQEKMSLKDFERFQNDVVSPQARMLVPVILGAFDGIEIESREVRDALAYLRNWNFEMRRDDVATSVFHAFLLRALRNVFQDELGNDVMRLYDTLAMPPMRAITVQLLSERSLWFDDAKTEGRETKGEIIRRSMREGLELLRSHLGGELKEWRWGRMHQVEFEHIFGTNAMVKGMFNVGPFAVPGSYSTVNNGYFLLNNPFKNSVGPSTRLLFDLSTPDGSRAVTPPGQSGHAYHPHYDDQTTLWLNGGYRRVLLSRSLIEKANYELLILRPNE
ncbi:MAG: penicillin acylase family protein [Ignavibacteria bacterium]|nr:penicillin acylase family protein [Ignavibacteria bacterium]